MKLSTRTRYGIRAAIELAANYNNGALQTNVIARRQEISVKYLEQLLAILKSAGLVKSVRGFKGGYLLAKSPEQIKLSQLFDILEGNVTTVECVEDENYCTRSADCVARMVWTQVQAAIKKVLDSFTLHDMVEQIKSGKLSDYNI